MKKKLFILGIVIALVAVLVVPMAVDASGTPVINTAVISGSVTQTATPTINTSTNIYAGGTSLSGTDTATGATITVTTSPVGSGPYTATVSGGTWTVSGMTAFTSGETISVIAYLSPDTNSTAATATVAAATIISFTPPTSFTWSPAFGVVANTGHATPGSIVSGGDTWNLGVSDATGDYMETSGSVALHDAIQVGYTAPSAGTAAGTVTGAYQTALDGASGYGDSSPAYQGQDTFSIPLYAYQYVEKTDVTGSYSITLNYTLTPNF